jgi:hypothetical protein
MEGMGMGGSTADGRAFERFAGWASVLAGIAGIGYALAFVVLKSAPLSAAFLTLAPLFAIGGLVAVFERVRTIDSGFATVALGLGVFGSLAASSHGAYDVANILHPPASIPDVPFAVDPRGYGTFALTGLALLLFSSLAGRARDLPGWVGSMGMVLGVMLVLTFLARLIVLDATSPLVLLPALVSGLLSPIFFLLLGAWLLGWRR